MEELKTKIIGLKEQIQILDNDRQELQNHLATVEKDYTESTLPVITDDFYELIESSIRKAVNDIGEELISLVLEGVTSLFKLEETENGN